jgi:hypothetical protein
MNKNYLYNQWFKELWEDKFKFVNAKVEIQQPKDGYYSSFRNVTKPSLHKLDLSSGYCTLPPSDINLMEEIKIERNFLVQRTDFSYEFIIQLLKNQSYFNKYFSLHINSILKSIEDLVKFSPDHRSIGLFYLSFNLYDQPDEYFFVKHDATFELRAAHNCVFDKSAYDDEFNKKMNDILELS